MMARSCVSYAPSVLDHHKRDGFATVLEVWSFLVFC